MKPLDVVIVTPKPSKGTLVGRLIGSVVLNPLLSGWALMLLLPLAADALDTPDTHPSYWQATGVVFLARVASGVFRTSTYPVLTSERKP